MGLGQRLIELARPMGLKIQSMKLSHANGLGMGSRAYQGTNAGGCH
jgi:hypothetical protein